jgi:chromosome segregation ATPase
MQIKAITTMLTVGCAVMMLTGCGVPKEDFEAKVSELNSAKEQLESLKGKYADQESLLGSERTKSRDLRAQLTAAAKRIAALKKAEAEAASALADQKAEVETLQSEITTARSTAKTASDRAVAAESELEKLQKKYEELQKRLLQYKKNMSALGGRAPSPAPSSAPSSSAKGSSQILDEMSKK